MEIKRINVKIIKGSFIKCLLRIICVKKRLTIRIKGKHCFIRKNVNVH
jgi:hypothetical protein